MKQILLIASLLFLFSACSIESDYEELKGEVTDILAPDTMIINHTASVEIRFSGGANGCANPSRLRTQWAEGYEVQVEAFYYFPKNPEFCPDYIPTHALAFTIIPDELGELIIRADDAGAVTDTIWVKAN